MKGRMPKTVNECKVCFNTYETEIAFHKGIIDASAEHKKLIETKILDDTLFSYPEICHILCDGCRTGLPSIHEQEDRIYHPINGIRIPCLAAAFRKNKDVLAKAFPKVKYACT